MPRFVYGCVAVALIAGGSLATGETSRAEQPVSTARGAAAWAPQFYAYAVEHGLGGVKPRPIAQQAKILHELGFDGIGIHFDDELDANLQALDREGLKLSMTWTVIDLKKSPHYSPQLPAAMAKLKGRSTTICVQIVGFPPGDPRGMEPAVKILRELGDLAAPYGQRISIYHHVDNWTESAAFALEVANKTHHPSVGANFNLCHWLKVDGDRDYRPLLRENAARVFGVTICGAQIDSKDWPHGMIQPLDRGNFDNRQLLAVLREAGYRGPIGLMCFGIPHTREHLARSMKVWKTWQAEWAKER